mmetsp:Transcript_24376/g.26190  ORF Transcript_24376/g.26190 Transcript_24376/m.26190 type:complete len:81 (+) Transcript_24376:37-279(+)
MTMVMTLIMTMTLTMTIAIKIMMIEQQEYQHLLPNNDEIQQFYSGDNDRIAEIDTSDTMVVVLILCLIMYYYTLLFYSYR